MIFLLKRIGFFKRRTKLPVIYDTDIIYLHTFKEEKIVMLKVPIIPLGIFFSFRGQSSSFYNKYLFNGKFDSKSVLFDN